jgi:hypothetical protein
MGTNEKRELEGSHDRALRMGLLVLIGGVVLVTVLGSVSGVTPSPARVSGSAFSASTGASPFSVSGLATTVSDSLQLGITTNPHTICAFGADSCPAGVGTSRVTLSAAAGSAGALTWPNVEVAFVIETTSYDGVFDPGAGDPGLDPCAAADPGAGTLCEESNGVPFFVANAQLIANSISAANPHSQVSFAMVDYFANINNWDDGDGAEYHVDIPSFIPSGTFGQTVKSTFQAEVLNGGYYYPDSDMSDNQLTSSSITAMYGTIIGSGLDWSNNTHHVIVWMGSTAPRDPNYPENYCVASDDQYYAAEGCIGATCEPSYHFPSGNSPQCEGWVKSQDGNATHSIAELAKTAPSCTGSVGGVCTVDAIDYYDTPTDYESQGWPAGARNGGPGTSAVVADATHIILAGCDIAAATGGTWDGPAWAACPNGEAGSLQYVPHGSYTNPDTTNPSLFNALREVGFGPVLETQVAAGTDRPIFSFVPFGNIAPAPASELQATASCVRNGIDLRTCQTEPSLVHFDGLTYLGWNWSTNSTSNVMYLGDYWTASFNVIATGPPYTTVPVDACTTTDCKAGGSGAIDGLYTSASYVPYTNNTVLTQSFPLGVVDVQLTATGSAPPTVPPAPPPAPPPFPILAPSPLPIIQQIGVGNSVGIANVSLQATAAGFLGAGFTTISVKNRPVAMKIAGKSGNFRSAFDKGSEKGDTGIGRFE